MVDGTGAQPREAAAVRIEGDRARMKQVVVNLLDNAIKYTPAGGSVDLEVRGTDEHGILEVADNGIGISAQHGSIETPRKPGFPRNFLTSAMEASTGSLTLTPTKETKRSGYLAMKASISSLGMIPSGSLDFRPMTTPH